MKQSHLTVVLFGLVLSTVISLDTSVKPVAGNNNNSCIYWIWPSYCTLQRIAIRTDSEVYAFDFPREKKLVVQAANVLKSGGLLLGRLPDVVKHLELHDGFVPEVFIKSSLSVFVARKNHVRDVIIDEKGEHSLSFLEISNNQLRFVPEKIGKLINLVKLNLQGNEIERINLDNFKGLTRLEVLTLYGNRITRINAKISLGLPNLVHVDLGDNYLENIHIKFWDFPNLKGFYLHNNRLRIIENFPEHFPNLTHTSFGFNRWSCAWLENITLWTDNIVVTKGDESCAGKSVASICCEDGLDDMKIYIADQLKQMHVMLERTVAKIDEKISNLNDKLRSEMQNEMDRTVTTIKEEFKAIESGVRQQLLDDFQRTNARVDKTRALIEDDRKQSKQKIGEMQGDMDRTIQTIREQVAGELQEINVTVQENRASIEEVKSLESSSRKQVFDEFLITNAKINENQSQMEKQVSDLKSDLIDRFSNTENQINDEFKRVKENLSENWALIEDIVEDMYLEELEKEDL